jgi:hypothetical protein
MVKHFLTGTAKGVTDSVQRVTTMMKGKPIPGAKPKPAQPAGKDFGKRTNDKS